MTNQNMSKLPIGLCIFGIAYSAGYVGRGSSRANPKPLSPNELLDLTARHNLSSLELPPSFIEENEDEQTLLAFRRRAEELGISLVVAGPRIETEALRRSFAIAKTLGATTIRTVLSSILCGDRAPIGGLDGWQKHLAAQAAILKSVATQAEDEGIRIGVENHQDATSADLVWLCETVGSPNIGVVLDTGNPLAVAEDVVEFAQRILPYLVHVHLKDYWMVSTAQGYRLVHCPIGAGVVDFAGLFKLFDSKPEVRRHIEMAALHERHIRMLDETWWAGHAKREVTSILPVLRLWRANEYHGVWQTPWESEEEDRLVAWEMERLDESVERMSTLLNTK
ncbi:MAG: sugar phosphate isomerase/epimerase family protein [Caldilineaceae bacterium]